MAYGIKHTIEFASGQILNDVPNVFFINILQKDYAGNLTKLTGTGKPFILSYQSGDESIIVPIRASECAIEFWNDGATSLTTFYSEDDEQFRIDCYYRSIFGDQLLWRGFLLQDSCQEEFHDPPFAVILKATDNIALLKDIPFDMGVGKFSLFDIITNALTKTGIELPLHILSNIYENTTNDRTVDSKATMFEQTIIFTGQFQSEDGTWNNYYEILEKLFTALNATLLQAQGRWYLVRYPEYKYFALNHITGTYWQPDFMLPQLATYQPNFLFSLGTDNEFINADHTRRITRPFKSVKNTFNYVQPKSLIVNSDLKRLGAFIGTSMDGLLRYDDYEITSEWQHIDGDTSFIRVVTDTAPITEVEKERYIVSPGSNVHDRCLRFNPIEVTKGDTFDFSLQFKTPTDVGLDYTFAVQFYIFTPACDYYTISSALSSDETPYWILNTDLTLYTHVLPDEDSSQSTSWNLSSYLRPSQILLIPADGILLIDIKANNDSGGTNYTTYWKDITINFSNYITESTKVIGQYHFHEQTNTIKNVYDEEIFFDDSPRNTIAGTLFRPLLTTFCADIGDIYFTRTAYWHRLAIAESRRLGEIITLERKEIASRPRTIIEGSFIYNQPALSIINAIQIASLPGLNFIWGVVDFDFYSGIASGVLKELYTDEEVQPEYDYTFSYIFQTS